MMIVKLFCPSYGKGEFFGAEAAEFLSEGPKVVQNLEKKLFQEMSRGPSN